MKMWPTWLGLIAGLAAAAAGLLVGADVQEGWKLAARYTARVAFPFFILTFVASSVVRLFRRPWSKSVMHNRRWWGLGFACAFGTHLVALLTYNWLRNRFPPVGLFDPGVLAYSLLLAMVVTSTNAARARLGRWWRVLHRTGMWVFFFIFVVSPYFDALLALKLPEDNPLTDPYLLAGIAALALRIAAWRRVATTVV